MLDTNNGLVLARIETRITTLEKEKLSIQENTRKLGNPTRPFKEMFEHAMSFLANPHKLWENGRFEDKRMLLKLAFSSKLLYTKNKGFRTPEISIPFKVLAGVLRGEKVMARMRRDTSNQTSRVGLAGGNPQCIMVHLNAETSNYFWEELEDWERIISKPKAYPSPN